MIDMIITSCASVLISARQLLVFFLETLGTVKMDGRDTDIMTRIKKKQAHFTKMRGMTQLRYPGAMLSVHYAVNTGLYYLTGLLTL